MRTATNHAQRVTYTQPTSTRSRVKRRKVNYGRATFLSFSLFFFLFVLSNVLVKIYYVTH